MASDAGASQQKEESTVAKKVVQLIYTELSTVITSLINLHQNWVVVSPAGQWIRILGQIHGLNSELGNWAS